MYRLLIVDDEPAIVNGLIKIFSENNEFEFDIYKAYSASQAIEIVKGNRVDILLSDINMPGMNGMKMAENILFYWPNCKIIFLTGFSEFEYIYEAIRKPNVNYILKAENDDVIIEAVENAAKKLRRENEHNLIVERAKEQTEKINHFLKKELIEDLLTSDEIAISSLSDQFKDVGIELSLSDKVFLIVARVEGFGDDMGYTVKANRVYAIKNSIEKTMSQFMLFEGFIFEKTKIIWILQPNMLSDRFYDETSNISHANMIGYLKNSIEAVQDSTKEVFNLSVSFALTSNPVKWEDAWMEYEVLKKTIGKSFTRNKSMIIDLGKSEEVIKKDKINISKLSNINARLKKFEKILIEGNEIEIEEICSYIFNEINKNASNISKCTEMYYRLSLEFTTYINKYGISERILQDLSMQTMIYMDIPDELVKAEKFFIGLGKYICMLNKEEDKKQESHVISKIERYIQDNPGSDLSLVKLAGIVYLNPSYLSRFYKQITGRNLSDYINEIKLEAAKRLLIEPTIKVSDIAFKLGFDSASYFSLFFKKMTGARPLEYRSLFISEE